MFKLIYKSKNSNDETKSYDIDNLLEAFDNQKEGKRDVGITAELSDGEVKRFRFDRIEALFRV
jgi:hypothetical protein